jgi:hypothetical protein
MHAAPTLLLSLFLPYGAPPPASKPADRPVIVVARPLGLVAGASTKIVLRGRKLDKVKEVRCQASVAKTKLLTQGSAEDVPKVGNTRAEIEITLPADFPGTSVTVTLVNDSGESAPHRLIVDRQAVRTEKEPNNGFAQAQPIAIGDTVEGAIDKGFDVDVYRFEAKAGQRIVAEIFARRHGSPLDSFLTHYTGDGQTVASNDDLDATTTDSRLEATLLREGAYFLVVIDANDHGSPAHVYRLSLREKGSGTQRPVR